MDFYAADQGPGSGSGLHPGRSIELVRNPGWSAATDDLRKAYPDEITVTIGGNNDDLYNKVQAGELDFVVDGTVPADKIKQYQTDPDLEDRINVYPSDALRYVSFNLASRRSTTSMSARPSTGPSTRKGSVSSEAARPRVNWLGTSS